VLQYNVYLDSASALKYFGFVMKKTIATTSAQNLLLLLGV